MLLFGRSVTYLIAKKKHKEKETLGSAARKEREREKEREKEKKEKKEREVAPRYFRITSVAPMKDLAYPAGVTFTLGTTSIYCREVL